MWHWLKFARSQGRELPDFGSPRRGEAAARALNAIGGVSRAVFPVICCLIVATWPAALSAQDQPAPASNQKGDASGPSPDNAALDKAKLDKANLENSVIKWLDADGQCTSCHFTVPHQAHGLAWTSLALQSAHNASSGCDKCHEVAARGAENALRASLKSMSQACSRNTQQTHKATYLGVSVSPVPPVLRQHVKLPAEMGLLVESVEPASPAAAAGLAQYDILEKLDQQLLVNQEQLSVLVRSYKPGSEVMLAVIHQNARQAVKAVLAEHEVATTDASATNAAFWIDPLSKNQYFVGLQSAPHQSLVGQGESQLGQKQPPGPLHLGVQISPPPAALVSQLKLPAGMYLLVDAVESGSPAEAAGVKAGDVLEKLDDQLLVNGEQLRVLVRQHQPSDELALTLVRGGESLCVAVSLAAQAGPATGASTIQLDNWQQIQEVTLDPGAWNQALEVSPVLLSRLIELRVEPVDLTSDEDFIRRAYLDTLGIAPEPKDIETFVRDSRPAKRRLLIDSLLSRPEVISKFNGAASLQWSDSEHTLSLTRQDGGKKHLLAKDAQGQTVFDGPVDTDEARGRLPPAVAAKLALMLKGLERAATPAQPVSAQELLERTISRLQLADLPLRQAVDQLRRETGANLVVNWKALAAAGVTPDEPISLELHDVRLATVLKTLLSLAGGATNPLGYTIDDGVILISTADGKR